MNQVKKVAIASARFKKYEMVNTYRVSGNAELVLTHFQNALFRKKLIIKWWRITSQCNHVVAGKNLVILYRTVNRVLVYMFQLNLN